MYKRQVYNDEMESKAIHLAGLAAVPVNSLKPYFGHTLGASGIIETIPVSYTHLDVYKRQAYESSVLSGMEKEMEYPLNIYITAHTLISSLGCLLYTSLLTPSQARYQLRYTRICNGLSNLA